MSDIKQLKDKDLEKVTGGANMLVSEKNNTLTVYMNEGSYSINDLFADAEMLIRDLGGASGFSACFYTIRPVLNKYKGTITKCVIDTNTFVATYYVGNTSYSQSEVDNW